jgi:hypothetical protein
MSASEGEATPLGRPEAAKQGQPQEQEYRRAAERNWTLAPRGRWRERANRPPEEHLGRTPPDPQREESSGDIELQTPRLVCRPDTLVFRRRS